jgi:uncharacterized protein (TIGR02996 family)
MTLDDAFLHEIIANPDDDTPRLIYADYLDERGDLRGEFIRVQVELAHLPARSIRRLSRRRELEAREQELLQKYHLDWVGTLQKLLSGMLAGVGFSRGFVEKVTVDARGFLVHAEELFRLTPLQHVRLFLAQSGPFPSITNSDRIVSRLAPLPQLARLFTLDLHGIGLGSEGVCGLATSPYLIRLSHFLLSCNSLGETGAQALADSPGFPKLAVLDLSYNRIGDAAALALAQSRHLLNLSSLDLRCNPIGPEGIEALRARFGEQVKLSE